MLTTTKVEKRTQHGTEGQGHCVLDFKDFSAWLLPYKSFTKTPFICPILTLFWLKLDTWINMDQDGGMIL